MSKNQKKLPQIHYFLKDKLAKLQARKLELESQLTVENCVEMTRQVSMVAYHIEVTEIRMEGKFKDQTASEYALMTSNKTYTGVQ